MPVLVYMVYFPHCKINLGLHVVSKRPDGFHNIETVFYPLPLTDILEIIPATSFSFSSSGLPIGGSAQENLCVKAFDVLKSRYAITPVAIHLHKTIPMGAGLGGGSSDGAITLLGLNEIFTLGLSHEQLRALASKLGSDCSFFLRKGAMLGVGKGDELSPLEISLEGRFIVLVKPEVHVSTADAYRDVHPMPASTKLEDIMRRPIGEWRTTLKNDFEPSVFKKYPVIEKVKKTLYEKGALYASMSGSGSSVFGFFDQPVNLKGLFPNMFYWSSFL